jgi:hypothetical protein
MHKIFSNLNGFSFYYFNGHGAGYNSSDGWGYGQFNSIGYGDGSHNGDGNFNLKMELFFGEFILEKSDA